MQLRELDELSRLLSYALLLSRTASALRAYQARGAFLADDLPKLAQTQAHLHTVHRAEDLVDISQKKIVPDLESVIIYECVVQALRAMGMLSDASEVGAVVDELLASLAAVSSGAPPDVVGICQVSALERLLDTLASIYTARARESGQPDYLETLCSCSTRLPYPV
jgi:hypothetical protein